jgi:3-hydroxyisobutyrate dehydrogenase-like beta-hydroxyacid dehydrogenase
MHIGFLGLGIMGSRMAARLQAAGHTLTISNRTREKGDDLLAAGATWATTPAEVGQSSTVIITMLAHPDAITAVALGDHGFLNTLTPGSLWIDCSTVHPSFSREMAATAQAHAVRFIDAPVTGSKQQAATGNLVFLVGGSDDDVDEARSLFEAMGQKFFHIGPNGQGVALKMVINLQLATAMASFAEGVAMGQALGLSPDLLLHFLTVGPVAAPFLAAKREKFTSDEYDAEFPLRWMSKDIRLALISAGEVGVTPRSALPVAALYESAIAAGYGDSDFSILYKYIIHKQSAEQL